MHKQFSHKLKCKSDSRRFEILVAILKQFPQWYIANSCSNYRSINKLYSVRGAEVNAKSRKKKLLYFLRLLMAVYRSENFTVPVILWSCCINFNGSIFQSIMKNKFQIKIWTWQLSTFKMHWSCSQARTPIFNQRYNLSRLRQVFSYILSHVR